MLNILYLILIHSCPIRQANQMTIITITITDNTATTYIYPDDIAINSLDIADAAKGTADKIWIYIRSIIKYAVF